MKKKDERKVKSIMLLGTILSSSFLLSGCGSGSVKFISKAEVVDAKEDDNKENLEPVDDNIEETEDENEIDYTDDELEDLDGETKTINGIDFVMNTQTLFVKEESDVFETPDLESDPLDLIPQGSEVISYGQSENKKINIIRFKNGPLSYIAAESLTDEYVGEVDSSGVVSLADKATGEFSEDDLEFIDDEEDEVAIVDEDDTADEYEDDDGSADEYSDDEYSGESGYNDNQNNTPNTSNNANANTNTNNQPQSRPATNNRPPVKVVKKKPNQPVKKKVKKPIKKTTTVKKKPVKTTTKTVKKKTTVKKGSTTTTTTNNNSSSNTKSFKYPSNPKNQRNEHGVQFASVSFDAKLKTKANISSGPGNPSAQTKFRKINQLNKGVHVKCLAIGKNGWVKIKLPSGSTGYIHNSKLE